MGVMTVDDSLPEEAKKLSRFVGDWALSGSLSDGTSPATLSGSWKFVEAANGWGVKGTLFTEIEGMGGFEETESIGFDAETGRVHMFSMNRFATRDRVGGWEDERTLVTRYVGDHDGREVIEEITVEFVDDTLMKGHVLESSDGQVVLTTELTLRREAHT